MARITTIDCPKILCSPLDTSKATFSSLGFNPGTFVNSGVSFFGGTLQLGSARAAVNIGPPLAIPGIALPFSLWVDGVSVFVGATFFIGTRISLAFVQNNGFHQTNGAKQANGAVMTNGIKVDNGAQVKNAFCSANANARSPIVIGRIFTGNSSIEKTTANNEANSNQQDQYWANNEFSDISMPVAEIEDLIFSDPVAARLQHDAFHKIVDLM